MTVFLLNSFVTSLDARLALCNNRALCRCEKLQENKTNSIFSYTLIYVTTSVHWGLQHQKNFK